MKLLNLLFVLVLFSVSLSYGQTTFTESNAGTTSNIMGASYGNFFNGEGCRWICGTNGTVMRSQNSGNNWTDVRGNLPLTNYHVIVAVSCEDAFVYFTISGQAYRGYTYNGGVNWVYYQIDWSNFVNVQKTYKKANFTNFSPDTILVSGNPKNGRWGLAISTDNGLTFDTTGLYVPQNGSESGARHCMDTKGGYVWFGTNAGRIYRGYELRNWQALTTPGLTNITAMMFVDTLRGMIGGDNGVLYTINKGDTWVPLPIGGSGLVRGFVNDGLNWWAARGQEIWFSSNNGVTWSSIYTAPAGNYQYLTTDSTRRHLIGIRDNGGVTIGVSTIGIHIISTEVPEQFSLSQNYPNPFNPTTNFEFSIPKSGFVNLTIYDITGREVATLVNEELKPGIYKADWDASKYTSGVYFYRLVASDFVETKKMMLIK